MPEIDYLAIAREALGRDVADDYTPTYEEFLTIERAVTERRWQINEEKAKAEQAKAERQAKLEADPLYEHRERATELRQAREAEAQKRADAIELVNAEHRDQLPGDASELDDATLYRLAYQEGIENDPDYLKDNLAANITASRQPVESEQEKTNAIYKARWDAEREAYNKLHDNTEGGN
jgi:hypothetical protein